MRNLKLFQTIADYESAKDGLILPNVSLCKDAPNVVYYNPYVPDPYNGHEYVDLGLPSGTKWAKYNVGATSETEYGNYYQYGKGGDDYSVTSGQSRYRGTEDPLATSADTAAQEWGGDWHMPTSAQCQELTANTTYEWTTINGVNGAKLTASNGNYIFIPAAGNYDSGSLYNERYYGYLRSSTPSGDIYAIMLYFTRDRKNTETKGRSLGYSVRAVVG